MYFPERNWTFPSPEMFALSAGEFSEAGLGGLSRGRTLSILFEGTGMIDWPGSFIISTSLHLYSMAFRPSFFCSRL